MMSSALNWSMKNDDGSESSSALTDYRLELGQFDVLALLIKSLLVWPTSTKIKTTKGQELAEKNVYIGQYLDVSNYH